jgi:hypothetical protein
MSFGSNFDGTRSEGKATARSGFVGNLTPADVKHSQLALPVNSHFAAVSLDKSGHIAATVRKDGIDSGRQKWLLRVVARSGAAAVDAGTAAAATGAVTAGGGGNR